MFVTDLPPEDQESDAETPRVEFGLPKPDRANKGGKKSNWADDFTPEEMMERFLAQYQAHGNQEQAKRDVGLPNGTFQLYKKKFPQFAEAVALIKGGKDPAAALRVKIPIRDSTLQHPNIGSSQDIFIKRYRKSRSRQDACIASKVLAKRYEEWREPDHLNYDKDFDDLMYTEELFEVWQIEEDALRRAALGQGNNVTFFLERLMGNKYGPPTKRVETTVGIEHWFSRRGEDRAREISKTIIDSTVLTQDSERTPHSTGADSQVTGDRQSGVIQVPGENGPLLLTETHLINKDVDSP